MTLDPMDMAGAEYVASLASPAPQLAAAALRVFRAELQRATEQLQQIRDAAGLPPDFALADLAQAVRARLRAYEDLKGYTA
jgi:hypothetical protein